MWLSVPPDLKSNSMSETETNLDDLIRDATPEEVADLATPADTVARKINKAEPAKVDAGEPKKRLSTAKWGPSPSVPDQFSKLPSTVRRRKVETLMTDVANEAQLQHWNSLQQRALDPSPTIVLSQVERQFYEGKWLILATVTTLEYQQI